MLDTQRVRTLTAVSLVIQAPNGGSKWANTATIFLGIPAPQWVLASIGTALNLWSFDCLAVRGLGPGLNDSAPTVKSSPLIALQLAPFYHVYATRAGLDMPGKQHRADATIEVPDVEDSSHAIDTSSQPSSDRTRRVEPERPRFRAARSPPQVVHAALRYRPCRRPVEERSASHCPRTGNPSNPPGLASRGGWVDGRTSGQSTSPLPCPPFDRDLLVSSSSPCASQLTA